MKNSKHKTLPHMFLLVKFLKIFWIFLKIHKSIQTGHTQAQSSKTSLFLEGNSPDFRINNSQKFQQGHPQIFRNQIKSSNHDRKIT